MHGTYPWLEPGQGGRVLVHSQNEAYGQERWYLTLEIGFEGGDWRVTGIDYAWRNTLDLSDRGGCTLDLASGQGVLEGPRGESEVASPFPAPTLWAWDEKHLGLPPDVCLEEDAS
jgi:hypothetical protein